MSALIKLHSPGNGTPYAIVVSKICYVRPGSSGGAVVYLTPDSYLSVVEAYDDVVAAINDAFGKRQRVPTPEEVSQAVELTKR